MNYRDEKRLEQFFEDMAKGYRIDDVVKAKLKMAMERHIDAMVEQLFTKMEASIRLEKLKDGSINVISKLTEL